MGLSRDVGAMELAGVDLIRVKALADGRLNRAQAAQFIGCAPRTLSLWQFQGRGPRSVLIAGRRWYFLRDLEHWIASEAVG
jgi:hypothetical protein